MLVVKRLALLYRFGLIYQGRLTLILVQLVVKSQVLAGGRGLGKFKNGFQGGVHIVMADKVEETAGNGDWVLSFLAT